MTDSTNLFLQMRKSAAQRHWAHFLKWASKVRFLGKIEITLAVASLLLAGLTGYFFYQNADPLVLGGETFDSLFQILIVVLLILSAFMAHRFVRMFQRRRKESGGKLEGRIVFYFGLITVIPIIVLAVFSVLILERGMQSWFSERVRTTLNNSLEVAEAYIEEHRRVIQADLLAMGNDLNRQSFLLSQNPQLLQALVDDQVAKRALSEAIVFDAEGNVLAQSKLSLGPAAQGFRTEWITRADEGEIVTVSGTSEDRVKAIIRLNFFFDTYLYVSRFVDTKVLGHVQAARDALTEYETLEGERSGFEFGFKAVFFFIAFLLLMGSAWIGFGLARQLSGPIQKLAGAAEKVGQGDFKTRLPNLSASDEIGTLSRAFNKMTRQLESQQKDLRDTNQQLDERRRFTEAVLAGVSAGVIGLDKRGNITLPNRSACEFLGIECAQLEGKRMLNVMPEFKELLTRVMKQKGHTSQDQITITRDGKERTLLVRIGAGVSGASIGSYVITFDDITDQLADQRTAAWADVARRIAHEIKNPLTPIQLSAERMRRKFSKGLEEDQKILNQCTDTIIRQVGDLRRMVDEFSSFARMPKPVFKQENFTDIVRQAVFLQEVSSPNISIELKTPRKPVMLYCDGRQMSQTMTNLLKNAVESIIEMKDEKNRKGDKDSTVNISIKQTPGRLAVVVEDTGLGLPEDMIERLMEPYVTTRAKGTGLGLAIVRKIMEDHYGTIKLENRPGNKGARVTLVFDLVTLKQRATKAKDADVLGGAEAKSDEKQKAVSSHGA